MGARTIIIILFSYAALSCSERTSTASSPPPIVTPGAGGGTSPNPFGDCTSRPAPPKDLSQVPDDAPPEMTLYDLGTDASAQPYDIHLSADGVLFWSQKGGGLYSAPAAGDKAPVAIGGWAGTLTGIGIATDSTHVYWLDQTKLRRKQRNGGAQPEAITLPYGGRAREHRGHQRLRIPCPSSSPTDWPAVAWSRTTGTCTGRASSSTERSNACLSIASPSSGISSDLALVARMGSILRGRRREHWTFVQRERPTTVGRSPRRGADGRCTACA